MSEMHQEYEDHNADPLLGDAPPQANVPLSNSIYDKIVASSLYFLPALAAAYFGLAQIWGLPNAEEVVGSVAVLETLLGALVKYSREKYNRSDARFDGEIVIVPNGEDLSDLNVSLDPYALATKKEITVRVDKK